MSIVETREYGSTTVKFCDDYCKDMGRAEIEKILKSISDKTLPYLQRKTA